MSGQPSGSSSSAAESGEEALLVGDDARDVCRLGRRVPHVPLERPAEQDAVRPREHVAEPSLGRITDLRLRLEDRELAADRLEQLIAEQVAAAEAGAVEDQVFRKS